jgi:hypothetical protein
MTVKLEAHPHCVTYALARTTTTPTVMFTVPAGATIVQMHLITAVASNAGTSATVTLGKTSSTHEYLNAQTVASTGDASVINAIGPVGSSPQPVYGVYAESGTASTTGGPFTVVCQYLEV